MIFDDADLVFEIAKNLNVIDILNFVQVNKNIYELKNDKVINKKIRDCFNSKATRIQNRFRKYLDKIDFIDEISDKANISISVLNNFIDREFCLVDRYYRSYNGAIGVLLLDLLEVFEEYYKFLYEGQYVTIESIITFKRLLNEYLR